jgi:hypothetical protein
VLQARRCYLGFAAPYLIVLASHLASYAALLTVAAALALGTAVLISRAPAAQQPAERDNRSQPAG